MSSFEPTLGRLVVRSPQATLEVVDPWLYPVRGSGAVGELRLEVPPGPYQVSARLAGSTQTRLVVVPSDEAREVDLDVHFAAAAPVDGTATVNESHGDLAQELGHGVALGPQASHPASLVLVLRGLRDAPMARLPNSETPFQIFDSRGRRINLPAPSWAREPPGRASRALGWAVSLRPGGYRVRWTSASENPVEHAVWLSPRWQTLVFVPQGERGPDVPAMSVHLLSEGDPWERWSPSLLATERALAALRGPETAAADPRSAEFLRAERNPMLVLLTLHLLARVRRAGRLPDDRDWTQLALDSIRQLRGKLGRHPDLAAVGELWRGPRSAPRVLSTSWPPMLAASLDLLLTADRNRSDTVPAGSLTEAVSGQRYAGGPWLLWDPTGLPLSRQAATSDRAGRGQNGGGRGLVHGSRSGRASGGRGIGPTPEPPPGSRRRTPVASEPAPVAVDRISELLTGVATVLQLSPVQAAERLGAGAIANRLGMAKSLVERYLGEALSSGATNIAAMPIDDISSVASQHLIDPEVVGGRVASSAITSIDWIIDAPEHRGNVYQRMERLVRNERVRTFVIISVYTPFELTERVSGESGAAIEGYYRAIDDALDSGRDFQYRRAVVLRSPHDKDARREVFTNLRKNRPVVVEHFKRVMDRNDGRGEIKFFIDSTRHYDIAFAVALDEFRQAVEIPIELRLVAAADSDARANSTTVLGLLSVKPTPEQTDLGDALYKVFEQLFDGYVLESEDKDEIRSELDGN